MITIKHSKRRTVEKCMLKCPQGSQNLLKCPIEGKNACYSALYSGEDARFVPFFFFPPLPFKKSVHATERKYN